MRRSARIAALNAASTSTKPNRKRKAEEKQVIVPTKQLHFHGPYTRQNWPFRDSFINYITKNPSNAKGWQKLIKSCKYFFAKNPVFVIDELKYESKKWVTSLNQIQKEIDFTKILSKLWVTNEFKAFYSPPENEISLIIPKIYKCDAKYLSLADSVISYKDFLFLSSNLEQINFHKNIVKNENDEIVPFEKLFAVLPKIKIIFFRDKIGSSSITNNTVKELLEIPHFSKIDRFKLFDATDKFDLETFFTYLKKNKLTTFYLGFQYKISQTLKNRLEAIIDEIIETKEHDYKTPNIYFLGITFEKCKKLCSLFYKR